MKTFFLILATALAANISFAQTDADYRAILAKSDASAAHLIATQGEDLMMKGFLDEIGASIAAMSSEVKASEDGQKSQELYFSIRKLEVGQYVPDFCVPTPDGKMVSLYEFIRGKKCVILDFWASWCSWCRKESPNIINVYNEYKSEDFDVISFSFDDKRERWEKAIAEDKTPWTQVSDLLGSNKSPVYKWYDLHGIPAIFLIDGEGRILVQNMRGQVINESVRAALGK